MITFLFVSDFSYLRFFRRNEPSGRWSREMTPLKPIIQDKKLTSHKKIPGYLWMYIIGFYRELDDFACTRVVCKDIHEKFLKFSTIPKYLSPLELKMDPYSRISSVDVLECTKILAKAVDHSDVKLNDIKVNLQIHDYHIGKGFSSKYDELIEKILNRIGTTVNILYVMAINDSKSSHRMNPFMPNVKTYTFYNNRTCLHTTSVKFTTSQIHAHLKDFKDLKSVSLYNTNFGTDDLKMKYDTVESLTLYGCNYIPLTFVGRFKNLKHLRILKTNYSRHHDLTPLVKLETFSVDATSKSFIENFDFDTNALIKKRQIELIGVKDF